MAGAEVNEASNVMHLFRRTRVRDMLAKESKNPPPPGQGSPHTGHAKIDH
jgi:hypothetical protein